MIIDRFEGDYAIIELDNGVTVDLPKILLPADAKEGNVIKIAIDDEATSDRKKRIEDKMRRLFRD